MVSFLPLPVRSLVFEAWYWRVGSDGSIGAA
jgi:hypothetical protein